MKDNARRLENFNKSTRLQYSDKYMFQGDNLPLFEIFVIFKKIINCVLCHVNSHPSVRVMIRAHL